MVSNRNFRCIVYVSFFLAASTPALADSWCATAGTQAEFTTRAGNLGFRRQIHYTSEQLANGNTLLRIDDSVAREVVGVFVPSRLNADTLMESLILVRTLRSEGASTVVVHTDIPMDEIKVGNAPINLSWTRLFEVAGADYFRVGLEIPTRRREYAVQQRAPVLVGGDNRIYSSSHYELAVDLARQLKISLLQTLAEARDGTHIILLASMGSRTNQGLFFLLSDITAAKPGRRVSVVTPYLPYARSDKRDLPGTAITAKLVADLIEAAGADAIAYVRLHAPQEEGFFSIPSVHVTGRKTLSKVLLKKEVDLIVAPDAGFLKEATRYAEALGIHLAGFNKVRDPVTRELRMLDWGGGVPFEGRRIAILDDEIQTGGTLAEVGGCVMGRGARLAIAVATHRTGSMHKALESKSLAGCTVTDTFPKDSAPEGVEVVSIAEELAEGLRPWLDTSVWDMGDGPKFKPNCQKLLYPRAWSRMGTLEREDPQWDTPERSPGWRSSIR